VHLAKYVNKAQHPTVVTSQLSMYGIDETSSDVMHVTPEWFDPNAPVKPFGERVFDVFADARYDAEHAALCIATGASTAAVFHLMRVAEWGVRALGKALGLTRIKEVLNPKPGSKQQRRRIKYVPIENCVWEKIQDHLRKKSEAKLNRLRPGPAKDRLQQFYGSVLTDFHGFRLEWRNHVMHTRGTYEESDALRALAHVERFVRVLAEHVK
jgi:hypothetical protein